MSVKTVKHRKCPYCGGTPRLKGGKLADGEGLYWIHCARCSVSQLGYLSIETAWSKWDHRKEERV